MNGHTTQNTTHQAAEHATLDYAAAREEHLRLSRILQSPDDALAEARNALLWLQLAHIDMIRGDLGDYCIEAKDGYAVILGMILAKLEAADGNFTGRRKRD